MAVGKAQLLLWSCCADRRGGLAWHLTNLSYVAALRIGIPAAVVDVLDNRGPGDFCRLCAGGHKMVECAESVRDTLSCGNQPKDADDTVSANSECGSFRAGGPGA